MQGLELMPLTGAPRRFNPLTFEGGTTPCRMTGVTLHEVVSPERNPSREVRVCKGRGPPTFHHHVSRVKHTIAGLPRSQETDPPRTTVGP